jgi:SPW repeat
MGWQNRTAASIPGLNDSALDQRQHARAISPHHQDQTQARCIVNSVHHYISGRREVSIMRIQHWQDVASLLLGVWLVLSPLALGFAGAAVWITVALGLCVVLFAVEAFVVPSYLEEWGEILLGLALVLAPWTVGYESTSATVNSALSGLLVIAFAVWELITDRDFTTWWHDRWHHRAN